MLRAETNLIGRTAEENLHILEKIFRRYSRCEEALLPPMEHAQAIKSRVYSIFNRYAERPEAFRRVSYRLWPIAELIAQLKGKSPDVDFGIDDKAIIQEAFTSVREQLQPSVA